MPVVIVELIAPVSSWRAPEAQTYHRTYPLPPYTTQVGLLGAAVGLEFRDAFTFVAEHGLRLGVGGWAGGAARDLWEFQKLDLVDKKDPPFRDILLREWRTDMRLALVVETPDAGVAERIAAAFRQPAFPLTAGPSDFLMRPAAVTISSREPVPMPVAFHALIPQEIAPEYQLYQDLKERPLTETIRAPTIERVPTAYRFDDAGRRSMGGRSLVTFVADAIRLGGDPIEGYAIEPRSRFLKDHRPGPRDQPWVIPVASF